METIKDKNGELMAIIYRGNDWPNGLNFFTPENLFIQAGSWRYPKGKILDAHEHKECKRSSLITQELVFVKKGLLKATLFNKARQVHSEFILTTGDLAVMVGGGHGYEILEEDTQILEVKNGPFVSVEQDKDKF